MTAPRVEPDGDGCECVVPLQLVVERIFERREMYRVMADSLTGNADDLVDVAHQKRAVATELETIVEAFCARTGDLDIGEYERQRFSAAVEVARELGEAAP